MGDKAQRRLREALEEATGGFPGTYELRFDVFHIPKHLRGAPWIETTPGQQTLAELRETLGDDEGYVTDGLGRKYFLSLTPWVHEDPETTYFVLFFVFVPDPARTEEWEEFSRQRFKDAPPEALRHDKCRLQCRGYAGDDAPTPPWPDPPK